MKPTKQAALQLYDFAQCSGDPLDYKVAADAMATHLKPETVKTAARKKRPMLGPMSKAYPGLRLPLYVQQPCGHTFNGSTCPQCAHNRQARMVVAKLGDFRVTGQPIERFRHVLDNVVAERVAADLARTWKRLLTNSLGPI